MAKLNYKKTYRYPSFKCNVNQFFLMIFVAITITFILYFIHSYFTEYEFEPPISEIIPTNQTLLSNNNVKCIVYVHRRMGRLGNNLFTVASAYGLARLHSCNLFLKQPIIDELKSVFNFDFSSLLISEATFISLSSNSQKPMSRMRKNIVCGYVIELTRPNAIPPGSIFHLEGYWQAYLHFIKYGDEIRQNIFVPTPKILKTVSTFFLQLCQKKFNFTSQFSSENHQLLKQQLAQMNQTTWIGIHIRRTDFLPINFSSSDAYIISAIRYYIARYPNAHFIVASDDKPYCNRLFYKQSNIFVTPSSFLLGDDLITLSVCQHSIMTGGTFGWWAGYLTNGFVVHDNQFPPGCENRAYYYPPWYLVDAYGRGSMNGPFIL
ncbi:hypothetical protein I4U23_012419 [Adineta vaga]|nr:hypothetical protein I4U23_012419 [Adineta vaga]